MPTRKYNKSKKKTVKRRKNKGGGGNFSRPKPPATPTPLPKKKTVRFPEDVDLLFKIKNISPQEYILNDNNDEDENKLKKKWNKWNTQLQKKGKNEISFEDYTKKMGKILKRKEKEEETEIDNYLAKQKNSRNTIKNKLAPLTMDEQLTIHMKEEMEKKR